jgi:hypothetical protein
MTRQTERPLGRTSDSGGVFLPPSFGSQRSSPRSCLEPGWEPRWGAGTWGSRRGGAAAFSSPAEEASSQADLSGIRPDGPSQFHARLTPVSYA